MTLPLVSIIIPIYNEAESIDELFHRVQNVFIQLKRPFEFIAIDDGSNDGSLEKLKSLREKNPNIAIIQHFKNFGKSLSLMQGFEVASGEIAITMDADLQDQPEEIPCFLKKMEEGYDLVNGWRSDRKDTPIKRWVSMIYNKLTALIFRFEFRDVNSGFKAYSREVYKWIDLHGDLHRLIPVLVAHKGFQVTEIPVSHKDRKHGSSKYRLFRHRGLLDIIALAVSQTTQVRPFHFFCELSIIFWFLAVLSLGGWFLAFEHSSIVAEVLTGIFGIWFMFIGTIFPIFGFYLEIEACRHQGAEWRAQLVKENFPSEIV
ncbi:MAG: glycosyltransferase [Nitrospinae bacterium CG11_big_fil_rev_8_21_14_0_20_45_15]|nr:MAG: glycosyltransferase [Nitrospinae bacterium CG11_big_fil_rev_8_21_14_0_20_45_15]